ncbi:GroES-like protein [Sarocladium strictum]
MISTLLGWGTATAAVDKVPEKTKQWTTEQNGIKNLKQGEVDTPTPEDGQVLVKTRCVSLNYRDLEVCKGSFGRDQVKRSPAPPLVPCADMCGVIVESKSKAFKKGTRVIALPYQTYQTGTMKEDNLDSGLGMPLDGTMTEYRCLPAEGLVRIPDYLSDAEASCLPTASLAAWMSINGARPIGDAASGEKRKETILVQGTDGVAVAGLQIAKASGLGTIVTAGSDDNLQRAEKDLKADHTINNRTHWEWSTPVLDMTNRAGADLIIETGGMRTLRKAFDCVAFGGTIACIGFTSGKGEQEDKAGDTNNMNINTLAQKRNVTLRGVIGSGPRDRMEEMLAFYEKNGIKPVIAKEFAFEELREAMKLLDEGADIFGSIVLKVS